MKTTGKWLGGGALALLGMLAIPGCGAGPTGPDEATENTATGIRVVGGGPELHSAIDGRWGEVTACWGVAESGRRVTVMVQKPEFLDARGVGVIRVNGTLCYGMRIADTVWVAPDLAALRHEFSHIVAERVTGRPVENGDGRCWL